MTPERYKEVGQLYRAALEVEPERRAAFLTEACSGDESLRQEVESLLGYWVKDVGLLDQNALEIAAQGLAKEQAESPIGQNLGHFQILSLLGKGGMGEVYQAQDMKLDRTVALKILSAVVAMNEERMQRFVREAKAASALNHPNVAHIYEIGEADGVSFIAMEYVEGQTLDARINGQPMAICEVVEIGSQIADVLSEAHRKGITHRDIKPANIMLNERGQVKVLDFGLAKVGQSTVQKVAGDMRTTASGVVMGTVPYMSPEQAMGQEVDHRSDIFSLGVVLYEMLTGRRPFAGETMSETIAAILRDEPSPLAEQVPNCPASLERIVNSCLAKAPVARYQTTSEVVAELRGAVAVGSQSAPAPVRPVTLRGAPRLFKQWRRWAALVGIITLIGLAAVYYLGGRGRVAESPLKTIAVLPPRPLQTGERNEALELGTTSTLITRLGSLRQLIVRPESAVEKYARPEQDPLAAGREQRVDAVLDSRYQRSGDKLRFRLRLLRVADGATLWADTLDLQAADPFAIEDALSSKVTGALRLTLSSAEKELLAKRYTNSVDAWQFYLRGRQLVHKRQVPEVKKAITYFERAIALDQGFALAHVMLGFAYASLNYLGDSPAKEVMPKAKAAYDQALKLDDQLAEAHTFLAQYREFYEWDFSSAEQLHQRALALNPNSVDVHHQYAFHLMHFGRFDQAIAEIRKAEELDPTDGFILRNVAQVLYFARRYDEAIEQSRRAVDLNPNSGPMYNWMIKAYEMKGDEQAALAACLKQAEARGVGADEIAGIKAAYAAGGLKGYRRRELDRQLELEKNNPVGRVNIPMLYAWLGDKDQALAWLQRATDERNLNVCPFILDPIWDSYRSDPRFVALLRRLGHAPTG
jgi:serine/threonine-protein kinase